MLAITLESVEEAFCLWRTQRSSLAELIPKNLWSMALELYPGYKRSIICKRLRLSGSQFKQRLEESCNQFSNKGFVLAARDESKANSLANPEVKLTIQGKERALSICIGAAELSQILPQLGMLL
jgi:hypothetical protein